MFKEDKRLLSDEMIAKKKQEIEGIDRQIEGLQWKIAGEPDYEEEDDYLEELYLNSPETCLDSLFEEKE